MSTLTPSPLTEALGNSDVFLSFQEALSRVATVDRPVLLVGERGTGKELAAARIHYLSPRWQKPLITVNCAALPASLLESELFGHEAGAFTGATGRRAGRFEQADGGTLFLDEIGTMPLRMQESILRVVEYGTLQRVGAARALSVDVRVIAATNADLPAMTARGEFMPDLLDRLSFEVLTLPPLRERGEDIRLLAERFAASMALELALPDMPVFSAPALHELYAHPWPGNIRELKNVVERAVFRYGARISSLPLNPFAASFTSLPASPPPISVPIPALHNAPAAPLPLPEAQRKLEQQALAQALHLTRHNQRQAADVLGLTYHQFRRLYRKHKDALLET